MKFLTLALSALFAQTPETLVYKRAGAVEIKADVFRARQPGPRPVILWIHGGALISGSRAGLRSGQLGRYHDAGFTVVSIDYRLAPETKLPEIFEDVRDAYAWIRRDIARGSPVAVVGHSAGGFLTLLCGALLEPKPNAIASYYGYGDIVADWYARPDPFYLKQPPVSKEEAESAVGTQQLAEPPPGNRRMRFYLYLRQQGLWPDRVAGPGASSFCPIRRITPDYPPAILLHGDKDTDVPVEQSIEMAAALKGHGVPHELVVLADRPHGFDSAMNDPKVSAAFDRALQFLLRHTR
ncbi:MAG: alpha/beta hydrolase [Acidobacteria bacterium]|nr:alpha/beta hydrolase [Acidobacteriota bacterium]